MKKIVVDTDIFLEHLLHKSPGEGSSLLRILMRGYFCYTTVFNAIELFSLCRTEAESRAVEDSLHAVKILGLNAKSARRIGLLFSPARAKRTRDLDTLIAGLCHESRLPLVTISTGRYRGIRPLQVLPARQLLKQRQQTGDV
ncbi:MAG: PIN domain-containing protein [Bacteroidota bacterium]